MKTNSFCIWIILAIITFSFITCEKENGNNGEPPEDTTGTFIDSRDGQIYKWIKIGNQIWMAENLNYTTDNGSWVYDNDSSNATTFGRLYDWETACEVCPDGWLLPSDVDWKELEMYLGMSEVAVDSIGYRGTDEGGRLKEAGTAHWHSPNTGATNSSGFSALPGGLHFTDGKFYNMGTFGTCWSSTEMDSISALSRRLFSNSACIVRGDGTKKVGYSIRCIKDTEWNKH